MKFEIKCRWSARVLFDCDAVSLRAAVEKAVEMKANLDGANLDGANLDGANLDGANLDGANLYEANLARANLTRANLTRANLTRANLDGANLYEVKNVTPESLAKFFQIPQEGEIIGWGKKSCVLVKLRVPPAAKRTGNILNRKCRAEWVEVLEVQGAESATVENEYGKCEYRAGQVTKPHDYCHDGFRDCRPGIHFFLTRQEAEEWS